MHRRISTVVEDDKPIVLLVGEASKLSLAVQQVLEKRNVIVKSMPLAPLLSFLKENYEKINIYKIIFIHLPHQKVLIPERKIYEEIALYRYDVTILFPLITSILEKKIGVFTPWNNLSVIQTKTAQILNEIFPQSSFIFIQDLIDLVDVSSPLDFIISQVSQGRLFDPNILIYPQVIMSTLSDLTKILLRPHSSKSYLLRGDEVDTRSILVQLKKEILDYYQVECVVYKQELITNETTPFVVSEKIATGNHFFAVKEFSRSISMRPSKIEYELDHKSSNNHLFSQVIYEDSVISPEAWDENENSEELGVVDKNDIAVVDERQETSKDEDTYDLYSSEESINSSGGEKTISDQQNQETIDVNKELQRIFNVSRSETKLTRYKEIRNQTKTIKQRSKRRQILFAGGISSILIGLTVIGMFSLFWYSQKKLISSISQVADKSIVTSGVPEARLVELQEKTTFLAQQTAKYSSIFDENMFTNADVAIALSDDLQSIGKDKKRYQDSVTSWISTFKGNESGSISLQPLIQQAEKYFSRLQSLSQGIETFHYLEDINESSGIVEALNDEINTFKQTIVLYAQLDTVLPQMLGVPARKTYAVILQNDQELRPTGGFIQAVAILKFDQGSLISREVYSSYELDQQLSGIVDPPEEIQKYLGENRWFFRDSNWDPHFPATASRIKWFLEKSTGITVDGVMALNLDAFATLLEATGPVELSSYNEVISHKNLYERMEFHSEVVLVENGSSRDYTKELLGAFLKNFDTLTAEKFTQLAKAFKTALDEKQLQMTVFDSSQQLFLTQMGWDGSIVTPPCPAELSSFPCRVEAVGQFEANIGINKANYYIESSIDHTVKIDPKMVYHTRRMTYKNIAESNAWPRGTYKAFVKLYIPRDSILESVSINTRKLPITELTQSILDDKKVVGFLLEVPIQSTSTVEVSFSTPFADNVPFSYGFFNQKQSGTPQVPITTTIVPNPGLHPSLIAPQAKVVSDSILFEQRTDSHSLYAVSFE